jgi:hypothetical protein
MDAQVWSNKAAKQGAALVELSLTRGPGPSIYHPHPPPLAVSHVVHSAARITITVICLLYDVDRPGGESHTRSYSDMADRVPGRPYALYIGFSFLISMLQALAPPRRGHSRKSTTWQ